ncbi:MAG: transposase [Verrucomicrobia bacterium]|nr:transposase [Verrucomicrobiota bacterium]
MSALISTAPPSLAAVFAQHWPAYLAAHGTRIPPQHRHAARAIMQCRTPELGSVFYRCDCGKVEARPVSCGHRACNGCGQHKSMEWEARQKARLLPVPYHMVTFTIPAEFRALFRANQELCYDLLFRESAAALSTFAADPQHLGGDIGMTGVLQTWTRDLRYHPHIHYLVPGGALTDKGWIRPKDPDILVPAKPLAVHMRNRMRAALKEADFKLYLSIPSKAWKKPWNCDLRNVGSGAKAMEYVARYVQKTALDAARIIAISEQSVSYKWTHRESGEARTTSVKGMEFLRLFLQHVLPRGFRRVRHYGYLSAAAKERYERLRSLLKAGAIVLILPEKTAVCCSACGCAMTFLHALRHHRARPPPAAEPTP